VLPIPAKPGKLTVSCLTRFIIPCVARIANPVEFYLYRAIDRDGNLVDTLLSATRSKQAAIRFFR
jgi:hypothetical protein